MTTSRDGIANELTGPVPTGAFETEFHAVPSLPKLAWCAVLQRDNPLIRVLHGRHVETAANRFFEGIWDGPTQEGAFDQSCFFVGSGGKTVGTRVIFASPCHTQERLHVIRKDDRVYVSNSMAFALVQSDTMLDTGYVPYVRDFQSIALGLRRYARKIPCAGGQHVELFYHCNLEIDRKLNFTEIEKPDPPRFQNFAEYEAFLTGGLRQMMANAGSAERIQRYRPVATLSSGYDSVAAAALGRDVGATQAITFNRPGRYVHDGGADIGRALGYTDIEEHDADRYLRLDETPEAEFLATGELGTDAIWASFDTDLNGKLVLTGVHGDKVWSRNLRPSRDIVRSLPPATSLYEHRLQRGFVCVPVPYFGCVSFPEIHRISNSEEMAAWTLGTDYDRPIPRRLAEQRGVKRELFGHNKIGAGFNMHYDMLFRMRRRMNPHSFQSFSQFLSARRRDRPLAARLDGWRTFLPRAMLIYGNHACRLLRLPVQLWSGAKADNYVCHPGAPSYLIHWGQSVIAQRYRIDADADS